MNPYYDTNAATNAERSALMQHIGLFIGARAMKHGQHGQLYFARLDGARNLVLGKPTSLDNIRKDGTVDPRNLKTAGCWPIEAAGLSWASLYKPGVCPTDALGAIDFRMRNNAVHYAALTDKDHIPGPILSLGGTVLIKGVPQYPAAIGIEPNQLQANRLERFFEQHRGPAAVVAPPVPAIASRNSEVHSPTHPGHGVKLSKQAAMNHLIRPPVIVGPPRGQPKPAAPVITGPARRPARTIIITNTTGKKPV